jgi:hypothetical protein
MSFSPLPTRVRLRWQELRWHSSGSYGDAAGLPQLGFAVKPHFPRNGRLCRGLILLIGAQHPPPA